MRSKATSRNSLIDTITWFLDEYRDQVNLKHLDQMVNIIESNYGDRIAKDWNV